MRLFITLFSVIPACLESFFFYISSPKMKDSEQVEMTEKNFFLKKTKCYEFPSKVFVSPENLLAKSINGVNKSIGIGKIIVEF